MNMRLKLAIVAGGWTNRRLAQRARIGEVRLSAIINGYPPAVSAREQARIARCLNQPISDLFPVPTSVPTESP